MPLLFHGRLPESRPRLLYRADLRPIESSVFDNFKVEDLAPYRMHWTIANFWHFPKKKHCAIAWHHEDMKTEQVIWMPGLLSRIDALSLAREEFRPIVPSSIVFRFNNENEVYAYV